MGQDGFFEGKGVFDKNQVDAWDLLLLLVLLFLLLVLLELLLRRLLTAAFGHCCSCCYCCCCFFFLLLASVFKNSHPLLPFLLAGCDKHTSAIRA